MTWTLSELGSIAEIVGLLAIVPSLIFVGAQLARGNREARASTIQAIMNSEMEMTARFADHAGTWDKVVAGEPLSNGEEARRGIVLLNVLMTDSEHRYHQFQSGYLDAQQWEARRSIFPSLVRMPIYKSWRNSLGAKSRSGDFLEILDTVDRETLQETAASGRKQTSVNS